jgi:hypothetical protein
MATHDLGEKILISARPAMLRRRKYHEPTAQLP